MKTLLPLVLTLCVPFAAAADPPPEEIVRKMDDNMTFSTRLADARMTVKDADGKSEVRELRIQARGESDSYAEFLSPERDKGIKYLKRDDNLYMYLPRTEKVVKISGHMLRQSMMDSDFSYEDLLESGKLLQSYDIALVGTSAIQGEPCWELDLTAKADGTTYARRKLWVSKTTFVAVRSELYARSGVLLKEVLQDGVTAHGARWYPARTTMRDKLRKGTQTVFELSDMKFDVAIPESTFSRRNLMRGN